MALLARRPDAPLHDLLDESGGAVQRAAALLREILVDPPANEEVARELLRCEQEADRITHDIIHRLNGGAPRGARRRALIRADDGHQLATALDDIVDHAEEAADQLILYRIEAPMEQALELADILVGACEQVGGALACLRTGVDLAPRLVEIHRLENEGDRCQPRRGRVALRGRHRPDGRDPLEGHLRRPRGRRGLVREGRPHPRGHRAAPAVGAQGRRVRRPASCAATAFLPRRTARTARTWRSRPLSPSRCAARAAPVRSARWSGPSPFTGS